MNRETNAALLARVNNYGDRWLYQKTRFGWVVIDTKKQFNVRGAFASLREAYDYVNSTFDMDTINKQVESAQKLLSAMLA